MKAPRVLVFAGACRCHGVGGFVLNLNSSSSPGMKFSGATRVPGLRNNLVPRSWRCLRVVLLFCKPSGVVFRSEYFFLERTHAAWRRRTHAPPPEEEEKNTNEEVGCYFAVTNPKAPSGRGGFPDAHDRGETQVRRPDVRHPANCTLPYNTTALPRVSNNAPKTNREDDGESSSDAPQNKKRRTPETPGSTIKSDEERGALDSMRGVRDKCERTDEKHAADTTNHAPSTRPRR